MVLVGLCALGMLLIPAAVEAQASSPAVAVLPSGSVNWFTQSMNNSLSCFDGYFWHTMPGSIMSAPAVAVRSTGEVDVVVQAPDYSLQYYWGSGCGSGWNRHQIAGPYTTNSAPAIFVRSSGEADVVAQGNNFQLMYYWAFPYGQWNRAVIGSAYSAPAIVVQSTGEADVVVQGANNSLVYYWATPNSQWSPAITILQPNQAFSAPAIIGAGLDVVVEGQYHQLWEYFRGFRGYWMQSMIAGTNSTYSAPAATMRSSNPTGEKDVVAQGPGNQVWYYHEEPSTGWYAYQIPSVWTYSAPAIAVESNGNAHVVFQNATSPGDLVMDCSALPGHYFYCTILHNPIT